MISRPTHWNTHSANEWHRMLLGKKTFGDISGLQGENSFHFVPDKITHYKGRLFDTPRAEDWSQLDKDKERFERENF